MTSTGVLIDTARFIGTMLSKFEAWAAVLGKPSRRKEAEGSLVGCGSFIAAEDERKVATPASSSQEGASAVVVADEHRVMTFDFGSDDSNQPRWVSSWRIRRSIRSSGTRPPAFIVLSTLMPRIMLVSI
jgi:hypothetical protein